MCWFEESAEIMSLPSPISQSWKFRLNISKKSLNPALKTIYRKVTNNNLLVIMVRILVILIITYIFVLLTHPLNILMSTNILIMAKL